MINVRDGIYGFIVGDALGVPVEFSYRFVLEKDPVRDMREFGTHFQPKYKKAIEYIIDFNYKDTTN